MTEREQFERFKAYMDAPCHELYDLGHGRNEPHHLAFAECGVPQEFLLWMWQAAEKASRRLALKEAALCADKHADAFDGDPLPGAIPTVRERNACRRVADALRALAQNEAGEG